MTKDEAEESMIENPGEQIRTITNLLLHLILLIQYYLPVCCWCLVA